MITDATLVSYLQRNWGLTGARVIVHNGGMGSQTWFVDLGGHRWVAKAVAASAGEHLAGGMAVADRLEQAGIRAGAAVPANDGRLVITSDGASLVLLTWVPGEPLSGDSGAERQLIGKTLAQVHKALAGFEVASAQRFHWVDPAADYLGVRRWLRPAILEALADLDAVCPDRMVWGLLHADPSPDAFRWDRTSGRCGVIDWSYALSGPLLYDLASAVMYVGGEANGHELIAAYLGAGILHESEVQRGLKSMLRFRWAVQANYFAWRIATNDLTGVGGPDDNERGLEDARVMLAAAGSQKE